MRYSGFFNKFPRSLEFLTLHLSLAAKIGRSSIALTISQNNLLSVVVITFFSSDMDNSSGSIQLLLSVFLTQNGSVISPTLVAKAAAAAAAVAFVVVVATVHIGTLKAALTLLFNLPLPLSLSLESNSTLNLEYELLVVSTTVASKTVGVGVGPFLNTATFIPENMLLLVLQLVLETFEMSLLICASIWVANSTTRSSIIQWTLSLWDI
jgi:hypothetical protein